MLTRGFLACTTAGLAALAGLAACSSAQPTTPTIEKPLIGVIMPDTVSSVRWDSFDRKYLQQAFEVAGVRYDIQNANGDKEAFKSIADKMIGDGAKVIMIASPDAATGKAVLQKAKAKGIKTIDYDRLTLGGGADYYVSFDNVAVGRLQADGLVKCLADAGVDDPNIVQLNGSPTDNNATLVKSGAMKVMKPKYEAGEYTLLADEAVPDWDPAEAAKIFKPILADNRNRIDAVLSANDGIGNAAVELLKKRGLNGRVVVTGQDATVQALQNILAGDQCMTVYKAIKHEADVAAQLAVALANGDEGIEMTLIRDTETGKNVRAVLLLPQPIYLDDVKDVVEDGFVTKEELCTADFATLCAKAGIE